jgi:hypothetical protein
MKLIVLLKPHNIEIVPEIESSITNREYNTIQRTPKNAVNSRSRRTETSTLSTGYMTNQSMRTELPYS